MKNNGLKKLLILLTVMLQFISNVAYGQGNIVVTLGNDLNQQQKNQILSIFGVKESDVKILAVTNRRKNIFKRGCTRCLKETHKNPA